MICQAASLLVRAVELRRRRAGAAARVHVPADRVPAPVGAAGAADHRVRRRATSRTGSCRWSATIRRRHWSRRPTSSTPTTPASNSKRSRRAAAHGAGPSAEDISQLMQRALQAGSEAAARPERVAGGCRRAQLRRPAGLRRRHEPAQGAVRPVREAHRPAAAARCVGARARRADLHRRRIGPGADGGAVGR